MLKRHQNGIQGGCEGKALYKPSSKWNIPSIKYIPLLLIIYLLPILYSKLLHVYQVEHFFSFKCLLNISLINPNNLFMPTILLLARYHFTNIIQYHYPLVSTLGGIASSPLAFKTHNIISIRKY